MDIEKFRFLAKKLGLKTGAEIEKHLDIDSQSPASNQEESEEVPAQAQAEESAFSELNQNIKPAVHDFSNKESALQKENLSNLEEEYSGNKESDKKSLSTFAVEEDFYTLPPNYSNKYNLTRGDFPPIKVEDAFKICLDKFGGVDIEYIASLSLLSLKDTILALDNKIYRLPEFEGDWFYKGYVCESEYLSGNLMQKYNALNKISGIKNTIYAKNLQAIKNLLPPKPKFNEIYMGLGAPWIPASYVGDFIQYLYRVSVVRNKRICEVIYQKAIGKWMVILNVDVRSTVLASKTYGTERMDMFKILEKTLNHEQIRISDADSEGDKPTRRLNREQTMLAEEKRTRLKEAFTRYLQDLPDDKKKELIDIYYNLYCGYKTRYFKGAEYTLKGNVANITLYDYQKTAVLRIMRSPSTLLAHDVGAGKTYAMIVSCHEMFLRNGYKSMIVVPNSILAQWAEDYYFLYPNAKVMVVTPPEFSPAKKALTLEKMRDGDEEAILISYSSFEMIESGYDQAIADGEEYIKLLTKGLEDNMLKKVKVRNKLNASLQKEIERVRLRVCEYTRDKSKLSEITFEDLNIKALYIDEAHNYKNLPLESSLGTIKGINVEGSKKCADVYLKTRIVKVKNGGKLIFATGTPVTNSVADVYVMQKYLSRENLVYSEVERFDCWAQTFGEVTCAYEIDVDTDNYRMTTRFNKFNNLGQLSAMLNVFTDFQVAGKDGLPEVASVQTVVVQKTALQRKLLSEISERVDRIRAGLVERKVDNLLKVTTDGRKLALDARLVTDEEGVSGNKIHECAIKVANIYYTHSGKTQLVFCDIGTPKQEYNVYDDLKKKIVAFGIGEEEVGFVHDATSDLKRAKMFESVNNGVIRILIGSTFKLGTGVNVQEKLIAIHHLDVPWRPSDMVQREGRLVRKGNTNEKVYIYRYVTDGSFDAYSWQLLENKQRFITELLTGTAKGADERKLDDAVLSYAEVKALAVGNPLVKNRVETVNEIARIKMLLSDEQKRIDEVEYIKRTMPDKIASLKERLRGVRKDAKEFALLGEIADKSTIGELITKSINENALGLKETFITQVGIFKIILPANFNKVHPYLILEGYSRYTVDIATFGIGAVVKIENFLSSLSDSAKAVNETVIGMEMQLKQAQSAVFESEGYNEKLQELYKKLEEIDKQLGI